MEYASGVTHVVGGARVWALISLLYITQGIPMGVSFVALPAILRVEGYSVAAIGFVGLMMLPWAAKFLWAAVVDRHSAGGLRRRRRWIVPAQLMQATLLLCIACWPRGDMLGSVVLLLLFVANLVAATQDIATDGLAVEVVPRGAFGWVNSAQIGGFALGMVVGGSLTLALYEMGGWALSFAVLAAITLASLLPLLRWHDVQCPMPGVERDNSASLRRFFRRRGASWILAIAATFYFARSMTAVMVQPFLVDTGFSLQQMALINGLGMMLLTLVAAILGGYIVKKAGAAATAVVMGFVAALALALWLLPAWFGGGSFPVVAAIVVCNGLAGGIAYVAFFTVFMQWVSGEQPGTDFTLLQSTETISNVLASIIGGLVAASFGYGGAFLLAAVIACAIMFAIKHAIRQLQGV